MYSLVVLTVLISAAASQCSYNKGDISASWHARNGNLEFQFTNKNIGNNQWTAMAFGPNMNDLETIVFMVQNNQASSMLGRTTGYAPPMAVNNSPVMVNSVQWQGRMLTARFSRPMTVNGAKNLAQCMSWKFVAGGPVMNGQIQKHDRGVDAMNVCPMSC